MNYGLQLSASGALASMYRMDVLANNLANSTTSAFKPDLPMVRQRDVARIEDGLGNYPSSRLLERLGGGVMPTANQISWAQGSLQGSSNPLDMAIEGDGFFVIRERTNNGADELRLSRDGRFTRDNRGWLVTADGGRPVMGVNNRPIAIPEDGPVQVQPDGTLRQNGEAFGQIQLTSIAEKDRLSKLGRGLYVAPSDVLSNRKPATGVLRQNALEAASVDAISTMMAISDAARAAESNFTLIQNHDRVMDRAINGLGRISA